MARNIAALCVTSRSPYKELVDVDCFDQTRNAFNFRGGVSNSRASSVPGLVCLHSAPGQARSPGARLGDFLCGPASEMGWSFGAACIQFAFQRGRASTTRRGSAWQRVDNSDLAGLVWHPNNQANMALLCWCLKDGFLSKLQAHFGRIGQKDMANHPQQTALDAAATRFRFS